MTAPAQWASLGNGHVVGTGLPHRQHVAGGVQRRARRTETQAVMANLVDQELDALRLRSS